MLEDYPAARVLLYGLMSEIRVRIYNLPLATYPAALTAAARLLDQKQTDAAEMTLMAALNTLVAVDQVIPLPLVVARQAIDAARERRDADRDGALRLLDAARFELERARELGYAGQDAEYKQLRDEISNLQKQLKANQETSSLFDRLQQRIGAFLKRQSNTPKSERAKKEITTAEEQRPAA